MNSTVRRPRARSTDANPEGKPAVPGELSAKAHTPSVERAFRILEELAANRSLTFSELATELSRREHIPKATLSNLLRMLSRLGYLRYRQEDRTHSLGIRLINLGEMAKKTLREAGPQRECRELLKGVVNQTKVGAHIAILDSGYAVYILREETPDFFGAKIWEGRSQVPHFTAVGKALICCLERAHIEEIMKLHSASANTEQRRQVSIDSLMQELAEVRECGWALDKEVHAPGVRCVAAPIYSGPGNVIASIGVSRRAKEFSETEMNRCGSEILKVAADEASRTPRILSVLARHYSMSNNVKSIGR
jgi:IclR family transcriptional regulator, KDG regulon repressor